MSFANLIIKGLRWLARKTPPRVITGRNEVQFTFTEPNQFGIDDVFSVGASYKVTEVLNAWCVTAVPLYLTRYFLTKTSPDTEGMDRHVPNTPRWGLYLHRFHRSDDAGALHNHPWKWAVSLVLKGGYSEERRVPDRSGAEDGRGQYVVKRSTVRPWSLNFLTHRDFHRVDLLAEEAWTLFLVGPLVQSWGFWDRNTGTFTDWKKFLGIET